jgi:hypothetical protein
MNRHGRVTLSLAIVFASSLAGAVRAANADVYP